jgi:FkbM family methyltransferase
LSIKNESKEYNMLAFLPHLLRHLPKPVGTILHIGAGTGLELELYNTLQAERVIAVEPEPTLFNKLKSKAKRFAAVQVLNDWIAPQTSEIKAHYYTNPRFNSLLAADGLLTHFTNLKPTAEPSIKALGINTLLEQTDTTDTTQNHILVLDVLGIELQLLQAADKTRLNHYQWVVVRTSDSPLYQGGNSANEISDYLAEHGFALRLTDNAHTPFIEHFYQFDEQALLAKNNQDKLLEIQQQGSTQLSTMQQQLDLSAQENTALKDDKTRVEQSLHTLNEALAKAETDKQSSAAAFTALQAEREAVQNSLQDVQNQKQQLIQQLAQQGSELEQAQNEKHLAVSSLQAEIQKLADTSEQLSVKQAAVNQLEHELAETRQQLEEQTHWHHENKKWAETLNKQCEELKQQLTERQRASDLSMKLQTKAQIDLDDLREKYQAKHHNEQKLVELIKELRQKLQQAAEYYHYLQDHYPELTQLDEQNDSPVAKNIIEAKTDKNTLGQGKTRKTRKSKAASKL